MHSHEPRSSGGFPRRSSTPLISINNDSTLLKNYILIDAVLARQSHPDLESIDEPARSMAADLSTLVVPRNLIYDTKIALPPPSQGSQKCKICGDLEYEIHGHVELQLLARSSHQGCVSCRILCAALEPYRWTHFRPQEVRRPVLIRWNISNLLIQLPKRYPVLPPCNVPQKRSYLKLHVCVAEGTPFRRSLLPRFLLKSGIENSSIAEQRIRAWLTGCEETHAVCRAARNNAPTTLPTRVLEILDLKTVRIYVPNSKEEPGRYACLSHCWGKVVPLRTTSKTIHDYRKQIEWNKIPPTFQHAIELTHRLGLRYLWIDSLCILQDSLDDWRHEGSSMADIYSKSYVTFAASSAFGSADGFYKKRSNENQRRFRSHTLKQSKDDNVPFNILVWEDFPIANKSFVTGDLPLSQRAWAYQERLLSPRTVHFADDMLYWECSSMTTNEVGGRMTGLESTEVVHTVKALLSGRAIESPSETMMSNANNTTHASESRLRITWYNIVKRFTRCYLTYPGDILPALQGVARRMQSLRQCSYYAGLWEDTLCSDLLWISDAHPPRPPLDCKYRAPSWSWAAMDGPVVWPYSQNALKREIHVISVSTSPAGDDPLGELTAGALRLRGRTLPGILKRYSYDMTMLLVDSRTGQLTFEWHPDCQPSGRGDQRVTVVAIGSWLKDSFYLVLAETNAKRKEYRRLGIARHEVKDMRSTMLKVLDGDMDYEACRPYEKWESCRQFEEFTVL